MFFQANKEKLKNLKIGGKKMSKSTSIKVVCRFRPLNKLELSLGGETCVVVRNNSVELNLTEKGERKHNFQFDTIFPSDATQQDVFEEVGKPVLERECSKCCFL